MPTAGYSIEERLARWLLMTHDRLERDDICELTDSQLGDLIARNAIEAGFAIEFDGAEPPKSPP